MKKGKRERGWERERGGKKGKGEKEKNVFYKG
jgi:hypothetical protein